VHTPDQSKTDLEKLLITFMKKIAAMLFGLPETRTDHTTNLIVRYREN
jgi:hypothetical protein